MFSTPDLLESSRAATTADTIVSTFQWLLILGFPLDVAAAKAMPELFAWSGE